MAPRKKQVLSREEFLEKHNQERGTDTVCGCKVRGLSAKDYRRYQAMVGGPARDAILGEQTEEQDTEFRVSDDVAWLTLGVLDPQLSADEWRQLLDNMDAGEAEEILTKIKKLSGVVQFDLELAKKVFGQIRGG